MFDVLPARQELHSAESPLQKIRQDETAIAQAESEYISNKTVESKKQVDIQDRLSAYSETGAEQLEKAKAQLFPDFDQINQQIAAEYSAFIQLDDQTPESAETAAQAIRESLLAPTKELLRGQEYKIQRAEQFTTALLKSLQKKIIQYQQIEGQDASKLELAQQGVSALYDAINAITYQDVKAAAVLVGDHGWPHLFQDFRDSLNIATAKKGQPLTEDEILVFGFAAAYHDIGYASPQVSNLQQQSAENYSVDQGHPLLGAAHIRKNQETLSKIFKSDDLDLLHAMVLYHENPEQAAIAGDKKYMLDSFAQADASAVMGMDKIPSGFAVAPEMLKIARYKSEIQAIATELQNPAVEAAKGGFYRELQKQLIQEITREQNQLRDRLTQQHTPEYVAALIHACEHVSANTLKFVGPRLVGEMNPPSISGDTLVIDVFGGAAQEVAKTGTYIGAEEALAKQVLKMYTEQTGTSLENPDLYQQLTTLLVKPEKIDPNSTLANIAALNEVTGVITLSNVTKTVAIRFNPSGRSEKNPHFTDQVLQQLTQAHDQISRLANSASLPIAT